MRWGRWDPPVVSASVSLTYLHKQDRLIPAQIMLYANNGCLSQRCECVWLNAQSLLKPDVPEHAAARYTEVERSQ